MLKFKIGISLLAFSLVFNLVGMDDLKKTDPRHLQEQALKGVVKLYESQETKEDFLLEPLNQLLSNGEFLKNDEDLWKKLKGNPIILFILNKLADCELTTQSKKIRKSVVSELFARFKDEKVKNAFLEALLAKKEDVEKKKENSLYFSIAQDVVKLEGVNDETWRDYNEKIEKVCKEIAIFESLSQNFFEVFKTSGSLPKSCKMMCDSLTRELKSLLDKREKEIVAFLYDNFNNYSALKEVFLKNPKGGTPSLEDVQIFIKTVSELRKNLKSPEVMLTEMRISQDNLFLNIVNTLNEREEDNVRELYSVFKALDKVEKMETGGQKNAKGILRTAAGIYKEYMKNLIINLSFAKDLIDTDLVKSYEQKKKLSYDDVILFFNIQQKNKGTELEDRKEYIKMNAYLADKLDDSLVGKDDNDLVSVLYKYCVACDLSEKDGDVLLFFKNLAEKTINDFYKAKKELLLRNSRLNNLNGLFSKCSPKEEYKLLSNVKNALIFSGESDDNELFKYIKDFADSEGQKVSAVSQFLKLKDVAQAVGVGYSDVLSDLYIICKIMEKSDSSKKPSGIKLNEFNSGKIFVESMLRKFKTLDEGKKLEYILNSNLNEAKVFSTLKTISDKNKKIYQFDINKHLNAVYEAVIYSDLAQNDKAKKAKADASFTDKIEELKCNLREKCHFKLQSSKLKDLKLIESFIENLKIVGDNIPECKTKFGEIEQQLGGFLDLVKNYASKKDRISSFDLDLLALYNKCVVDKEDFDYALRQKIENLVEYLNKVLSDENLRVLKELLERMLGSCNRDLTIDNKLNLIKLFLTQCASVEDRVSKLEYAEAMSLYKHAKKHFLSNQLVKGIKRTAIFDETCQEVTMVTNFAGENLCKSMKNLWNKLSGIKANVVYFHKALPEDCLGFRVVREYTIDRDHLGEYIGNNNEQKSSFINAKLENNKVGIREYDLPNIVKIRTVEQVSLDKFNKKPVVVPITFFFMMNGNVNKPMSPLSDIAINLEKKLNPTQRQPRGLNPTPQQPPKKNPTQPQQPLKKNPTQPNENPTQQQPRGLNPNAKPFIPKNKAQNPNVPPVWQPLYWPHSRA